MLVQYRARRAGGSRGEGGWVEGNECMHTCIVPILWSIYLCEGVCVGCSYTDMLIGILAVTLRIVPDSPSICALCIAIKLHGYSSPCLQL